MIRKKEIKDRHLKSTISLEIKVKLDGKNEFLHHLINKAKLGSKIKLKTKHWQS